MSRETGKDWLLRKFIPVPTMDRDEEGWDVHGAIIVPGEEDSIMHGYGSELDVAYGHYEDMALSDLRARTARDLDAWDEQNATFPECESFEGADCESPLSWAEVTGLAFGILICIVFMGGLIWHAFIREMPPGPLDLVSFVEGNGDYVTLYVPEGQQESAQIMANSICSTRGKIAANHIGLASWTNSRQLYVCKEG